MQKGIIVLGAGGHAKVCIELLRAAGMRVDYAVGGPNDSGSCVGAPIIGGDHHLAELRAQGYSNVFIAVGANGVRQRLALLVAQHGFALVNAISPSATISKTVVLGSGIAIMAGAVINAEAEVGDLAIINTGATVDHDCQIERAVHLAPQCALAGNVRVGERSFLGIGTKVIPDIRIGSDTLIGAGSVVVSDIGDGVTAMGVPARAREAAK